MGKALTMTIKVDPNLPTRFKVWRPDLNRVIDTADPLGEVFSTPNILKSTIKNPDELSQASIQIGALTKFKQYSFTFVAVRSGTKAFFRIEKNDQVTILYNASNNQKIKKIDAAKSLYDELLYELYPGTPETIKFNQQVSIANKNVGSFLEQFNYLRTSNEPRDINLPFYMLDKNGKNVQIQITKIAAYKHPQKAFQIQIGDANPEWSTGPLETLFNKPERFSLNTNLNSQKDVNNFVDEILPQFARYGLNFKYTIFISCPNGTWILKKTDKDLPYRLENPADALQNISIRTDKLKDRLTEKLLKAPDADVISVNIPERIENYNDVLAQLNFALDPDRAKNRIIKFQSNSQVLEFRMAKDIQDNLITDTFIIKNQSGKETTIQGEQQALSSLLNNDLGILRHQFSEQDAVKGRASVESFQSLIMLLENDAIIRKAKNYSILIKGPDGKSYKFAKTTGNKYEIYLAEKKVNFSDNLENIIEQLKLTLYPPTPSEKAQTLIAKINFGTIENPTILALMRKFEQTKKPDNNYDIASYEKLETSYNAVTSAIELYKSPALKLATTDEDRKIKLQSTETFDQFIEKNKTAIENIAKIVDLRQTLEEIWNSVQLDSLLTLNFAKSLIQEKADFETFNVNLLQKITEAQWENPNLAPNFTKNIETVPGSSLVLFIAEKHYKEAISSSKGFQISDEIKLRQDATIIEPQIASNLIDTNGLTAEAKANLEKYISGNKSDLTWSKFCLTPTKVFNQQIDSEAQGNNILRQGFTQITLEQLEKFKDIKDKKTLDELLKSVISIASLDTTKGRKIDEVLDKLYTEKLKNLITGTFDQGFPFEILKGKISDTEIQALYKDYCDKYALKFFEQGNTSEDKLTEALLANNGIEDQQENKILKDTAQTAIENLLTKTIVTYDNLSEALRNMPKVDTSKPRTILLKGVYYFSDETSLIIRITPANDSNPKPQLTVLNVEGSAYAPIINKPQDFNPSELAQIFGSLNIKSTEKLSSQDQALRDIINPAVQENSMIKTLSSPSARRYISTQKYWEQYSKIQDKNSAEAKETLFRAKSAYIIESAYNQYFFDANGGIRTDLNPFEIKNENLVATIFNNTQLKISPEQFQACVSISSNVNDILPLTKAYYLFTTKQPALQTSPEYIATITNVQRAVQLETWEQAQRSLFNASKYSALPPTFRPSPDTDYGKETITYAQQYYATHALEGSVINANLLSSPSTGFDKNNPRHQQTLTDYIKSNQNLNVYNFALAQGVTNDKNEIQQLSVNNELKTAFANTYAENTTNLSQKPSDFITTIEQISDLENITTNTNQLSAVLNKLGEISFEYAKQQLASSPDLIDWKALTNETYFDSLPNDAKYKIFTAYALKWQELNTLELNTNRSRLTIAYGENLANSGVIGRTQLIKFKATAPVSMTSIDLDQQLSQAFQSNQPSINLSTNPDILHNELNKVITAQGLANASFTILNAKVGVEQNISENQPWQCVLRETNRTPILVRIKLEGTRASVKFTALDNQDYQTASFDITATQNEEKKYQFDVTEYAKLFFQNIQIFSPETQPADIQTVQLSMPATQETKPEKQGEMETQGLSVEAQIIPPNSLSWDILTYEADNNRSYFPGLESTLSEYLTDTEKTQIQDFKRGYKIIKDSEGKEQKIKVTDNLLNSKYQLAKTVILSIEKDLSEPDINKLGNTLTDDKGKKKTLEHFFRGPDGDFYDFDWILELETNEIPSRKVRDILQAELDAAWARYEGRASTEAQQALDTKTFGLDTTPESYKEIYHDENYIISIDAQGENYKISPTETLKAKSGEKNSALAQSVAKGLDQTFTGIPEYATYKEMLASKYPDPNEQDKQLGKTILRLVCANNAMHSTALGSTIGMQSLDIAAEDNLRINIPKFKPQAQSFFAEQLNISQRQPAKSPEVDLRAGTPDQKASLQEKAFRSEQDVTQLLREIYTIQVEAGHATQLSEANQQELEELDSQILEKQKQLIQWQSYGVYGDGYVAIQQLEFDIADLQRQKTDILAAKVPDYQYRLDKANNLLTSSPALKFLEQEYDGTEATSFTTKMRLIDNTYGQITVPREMFDQWGRVGRQAREEFEKNLQYANFGQNIKAIADQMFLSFNQLPSIISRGDNNTIELNDLLLLGFNSLQGSSGFFRGIWDGLERTASPVAEFKERMSIMEELKKLSLKPDPTNFKKSVKLLKACGIDYGRLPISTQKEIKAGRCYITEIADRYEKTNLFLENAYLLLNVFRKIFAHKADISTQESEEYYDIAYPLNREPSNHENYTLYGLGNTYSWYEFSPNQSRVEPTTADAAIAIIKKEIYKKHGVTDPKTADAEKRTVAELEFRKLMENPLLMRQKLQEVMGNQKNKTELDRILEVMQKDFAQDKEKYAKELQSAKRKIIEKISGSNDPQKDLKVARTEKLFIELSQKWTYEYYLNAVRQNRIVKERLRMNLKNLENISQIAGDFEGPYGYQDIITQTQTKLDPRLKTEESLGISKQAINKFINGLQSSTNPKISRSIIHYCQNNPDAILRAVAYTAHEDQWLDYGNQMWALSSVKLDSDINAAIASLNPLTQTVLHNMAFGKDIYRVLNDIPDFLMPKLVETIYKNKKCFRTRNPQKLSTSLSEERYAGAPDKDKAKLADILDIHASGPRISLSLARKVGAWLKKEEIEEASYQTSTYATEVRGYGDITADHEALYEFLTHHEGGAIVGFNKSLEQAFISMTIDRQRYIAQEKNKYLEIIRKKTQDINKWQLGLESSDDTTKKDLEEKITKAKKDIQKAQQKITEIDQKYQNKNPDYELETSAGLIGKFCEIWTLKSEEYRKKAIADVQAEISDHHTRLNNLNEQIDQQQTIIDAQNELLDSQFPQTQNMNFEDRIKFIDILKAYNNLSKKDQNKIKTQQDLIESYRQDIDRNLRALKEQKQIFENQQIFINAPNNAGLDEKISDLDKKISPIQSQIEANQSEITALQEQLVPNPTEINRLTKLNNELTTQLTNLKAQKSQLETQKQDVDTAQRDMSKAEKSIQYLQQNITELYCGRANNAEPTASVKTSFIQINEILGVSALDTSFDSSSIIFNAKRADDGTVAFTAPVQLESAMNFLQPIFESTDNNSSSQSTESETSLKDILEALKRAQDQLKSLNKAKNTENSAISALKQEINRIQNSQDSIDNSDRLRKHYDTELQTKLQLFRDDSEDKAINKIQKYFSEHADSRELFDVYSNLKPEEYEVLSRVAAKGTDNLRNIESAKHTIELISESFPEHPEIQESLLKIFEMANSQGQILKTETIWEYAKQLKAYYDKIKKGTPEPDYNAMVDKAFTSKTISKAVKEILPVINNSLINLKLAVNKSFEYFAHYSEDTNGSRRSQIGFSLTETLDNPNIKRIYTAYLPSNLQEKYANGEDPNLNSNKIANDWMDYCELTITDPEQAAQVFNDSPTLQALYTLINEKNALTAIFNQANKIPSPEAKTQYLGGVLFGTVYDYQSSLTEEQYQQLNSCYQIFGQQIPSREQLSQDWCDLRSQLKKDIKENIGTNAGEAWQNLICGNIDILGGLSHLGDLMAFELPTLELGEGPVKFRIKAQAPGLQSIQLNAEGELQLSKKDTLVISAGIATQIRSILSPNGIIGQNPAITPIEFAQAFGLHSGVEYTHAFNENSALSGGIDISAIGVSGHVETKLNAVTLFAKANIGVLGMGGSIGIMRQSLAEEAKKKFDNLQNSTQEYLAETSQNLQKEIQAQLLASSEAQSTLKEPNDAKILAESVTKKAMDLIMQSDETEFKLAMAKKEGPRWRGLEIGWQNGTPYFKILIDFGHKIETFRVFPPEAVSREILDTVTTGKLNRNRDIIAGFGWKISPELEQLQNNAMQRAKHRFSRADLPGVRLSSEGRPVVLASRSVNVGQGLQQKPRSLGSFNSYLDEYNEAVAESGLNFEKNQNCEPNKYEAKMNIQDADNALVEVWIDEPFKQYLRTDGPNFYLSFRSGYTPLISRNTIIYAAKNGGYVKHEIISIRFARIEEVRGFENFAEYLKKQNKKDVINENTANKFKKIGKDLNRLEKKANAKEREYEYPTDIFTYIDTINEDDLSKIFSEYFSFMGITINENEKQGDLKSYLKDKINNYILAISGNRLKDAKDILEESYFAAFYHLMAIESYRRETVPSLDYIMKHSSSYSLQYINGTNQTISDAMDIKNGDAKTEHDTIAAGIDQTTQVNGKSAMERELDLKAKLDLATELKELHTYDQHVIETLRYGGAEKIYEDIESMSVTNREYLLFLQTTAEKYKTDLATDKRKYTQEYFNFIKTKPQDLQETFENYKTFIKDINFSSRDQISTIFRANESNKIDPKKSLPTYVNELLGSQVYEALASTGIFKSVEKFYKSADNLTSVKTLFDKILYAVIKFGAKNKLIQNLNSCEYTEAGLQNYLSQNRDQFIARMPTIYHLLLEEKLGLIDPPSNTDQTALDEVQSELQKLINQANPSEKDQQGITALRQQEAKLIKQIQLYNLKQAFSLNNPEAFSQIQQRVNDLAKYLTPNEDHQFPIDKKFIEYQLLSDQQKKDLRLMTPALVGTKDKHGLEFLPEAKGLINIDKVLADTMIDIHNIDAYDPSTIMDVLYNYPGFISELNEAIKSNSLLKDEYNNGRYPTAAEREYLLSYIVYYTLRQTTKFIPAKCPGLVNRLDNNPTIAKENKENPEFGEQYNLSDMYDRAIGDLQLKTSEGNYTTAGKFLVNIMLNHPSIANLEESEKLAQANDLAQKVLNKITGVLRSDQSKLKAWLKQANSEDLETYMQLVENVQVLKITSYADPLSTEMQAAMAELSTFIQTKSPNMQVDLLGLNTSDPDWDSIVSTSVKNNRYSRSGARTLIHTDPDILSKFIFSDNYKKLWLDSGDSDFKTINDACLYFLSPIPETPELRTSRLDRTSSETLQAFNNQNIAQKTTEFNTQLEALMADKSITSAGDVMDIAIKLKTEPSLNEILKAYNHGSLLDKPLDDVLFSYILDKYKNTITNYDQIRKEYEMEKFAFDTFNSPLGAKLSATSSVSDFLEYFIPQHSGTEGQILQNLQNLRQTFYQPHLNQEAYRQNINQNLYGSNGITEEQLTSYNQALESFRSIIEMYRYCETLDIKSVPVENHGSITDPSKHYQISKITDAEIVDENLNVQYETLLKVKDTTNGYEYYLKPDASGGFVIFSPCTNLSTAISEKGGIYYKRVGISLQPDARIIAGKVGNQETIHELSEQSAEIQAKQFAVGGMVKLNQSFAPPPPTTVIEGQVAGNCEVGGTTGDPGATTTITPGDGVNPTNGPQ